VAPLIDPSTPFDPFRVQIARAFRELTLHQVRISSGRRLLRPSDHPADAARALRLRAAVQAAGNSADAAAQARLAVESQATALQTISLRLTEARARAEQAASGIAGETDLRNLATEIDSILEEILSLANGAEDGRFLFSGSRTTTAPFSLTRAGGQVASVEYEGDSLSRRVRFGPLDERAVDLPGDRAFLSFDRRTTTILGSTGLGLVSGAADTMTGSARLVLSHLSTTLGDGLLPGGGDATSGLRPGTSTASDTILGSHTLAVTQDPSGGGTISLNGGPPVAFTGGETDLAVADGTGAIVHVDVTGLVTGFSGNVAATGSGQIAVEGGPPAPLAFVDSFVLDDGTGRVVHLDTSGVRTSGDAVVVFPGTESIFDALIAIRDEILAAADSGNRQELADRIQVRLGSLDAAHDGLLSSLSELGTRGASFERMESAFGLLGVNSEERRAAVEDLDLVDASIRLARAEATYQAALAVAARVATTPRLMDFL
jgi:flagellin-like hook-associated protein FlgL